MEMEAKDALSQLRSRHMLLLQISMKSSPRTFRGILPDFVEFEIANVEGQIRHLNSNLAKAHPFYESIKTE